MKIFLVTIIPTGAGARRVEDVRVHACADRETAEYVRAQAQGRIRITEQEILIGAPLLPAEANTRKAISRAEQRSQNLELLGVTDA